MKKRILAVFATAIVVMLCFFAYKANQKYKHDKAIALQKQNLPNFQFYNQNVEKFSAALLKPNIPVCIFYYNTDCEHCQYEATQISKYAPLFKNIQVLMVSVNTPAQVRAFAKTYQLSSYPYITWLYDKDYEFFKWFGHSPTPSVFIYNQKHMLVKEYRGEVKPGAIVKYLKDAKKS